eukprot:1344128-Alexandrium_andersonii.AAC.1
MPHVWAAVPRLHGAKKSAPLGTSWSFSRRCVPAWTRRNVDVAQHHNCPPQSQDRNCHLPEEHNETDARTGIFALGCPSVAHVTALWPPAAIRREQSHCCWHGWVLNAGVEDGSVSQQPLYTKTPLSLKITFPRLVHTWPRSRILGSGPRWSIEGPERVPSVPGGCFTGPTVWISDGSRRPQMVPDGPRRSQMVLDGP